MPSRRPIRVLPALTVAGAAFLLALPAQAQTVVNVHLSSAAVQGNLAADGNGAPTMSDAGRHVAFASSATNLVAGDTNGMVDIFARDLTSGTTVMISVAAGGGPADGDSYRPAISGNGRYVAFQSSATNLVAGDTNALPDVFRYDRDTDADGIFDEAGATAMIRVSVSTAGAQANGVSLSNPRAISDDGNLVVFESDAPNLVAGDTNLSTDCFLRNVSAATTIRVSVGAGGLEANGGTGSPAISGDGSAVAFQGGTFPDNLVAGDTNGFGDVFVRYLGPGTTVRASVATGGAQELTGGASFPNLSDNGLLVVFESSASDLVAGDNNERNDIFLRDVLAGTTTRVSVSTGGYQGVVTNGGGTISGDGRSIAWNAFPDEFVIGDTNGATDVYVRDWMAGLTVRASRSAAGVQGNGASFAPTLSDDGLLVAFISAASNLVAGDGNGVMDVLVRGEPFVGVGSPFIRAARVDENPVSFSVDGPVDPNTEGIRDPRGGPVTPEIPPPVKPGDGLAFGIRTPARAQASGLPTPRPGDVFDYFTPIPPPPPPGGAIPSDPVVFQSPEVPVGLLAFPGPPAPPDGTNNQFAEAMASGLVDGPAVAPPLWTTVPPMAPERDNIDALSFGEDYFPPLIITSPLTLPIPAMTPWSARVSIYGEPIVTSDAPGISFRFSVDPWAIGAAGTAVALESGGVDVGGGLAWTSPGVAAGDVFGTPILTRAGGMTLGGGTNLVVHENMALGLAPLAPALAPAEDDIDALECVGENQEWPPGGFILRPGNIHERMMHVGPSGLPSPGLSWHDPYNHAPYFFSVTRNSIGEAGSAVRSQFVLDGGAAADVFMAVKNPAAPAPGDGTNLLFIDNNELGLYAVSDPSSPYPTAADYTDDLDALILRVCPAYRATIITAIDEILGIIPPPGGGPPVMGGAAPWVGTVGGALIGGGMTLSITQYLAGTGRPIPPDCIRAGFSVTTDAVGLEYTGVDWEVGPVAPPGGVSSAAGDVFFASVGGAPINRNWLWYEAEDLGLDPGAWFNNSVTTRSLDALSDNLDGLDSIDQPLSTVGVPGPDRPRPVQRLELAPVSPNPFRERAEIDYAVPREGPVRVTIHDLRGRTVATLVNGVQTAGEHRLHWTGREEGGGEAVPGVYFVHVTAAGESRVAKLVRIR